MYAMHWKKHVSQGLGAVSYTSARATVKDAFHSKQGLQIWTQCLRVYHTKSTSFSLLARNPVDLAKTSINFM